MDELYKVDETLWPRTHEFLINHISSSLFLLSNYKEHGLEMGEHPNSGYFYVRINEGKVTGVFSYTRRGNVIFQDGGELFHADAVLERIKRDVRSPLLRGSLGTQPSAKSFFESMTSWKIVSPSFASNEVLYSIDLTKKSFVDIRGLSHASSLSDQDFPQWYKMMKAFAKEVGLNDSLTKEQYLDNFTRHRERQTIMGIKVAGELVSAANLNASYKTLGQVGGVYTEHDHRKKGLAHLVMSAFMEHCKSKLGVETMILFTGEDNIPARTLYEKLGYESIGHFGLYFGESL